MEKITGLNNEMAVLANQHERLVGDSIPNPHLHVPPELYQVAKVKFDVAPPKSLDLRLATEREEQRVADVLKEQRPVVNKILERAGEKWPECPTCGSRMLAQRRGPETPAYGMSDDGSRGFANSRCPKHGEQTRDIVFPARAVRPGDRILIEGPPAPLQSAFAGLPPNASHGLATPGLTDQHKGGETK